MCTNTLSGPRPSDEVSMRGRSGKTRSLTYSKSVARAQTSAGASGDSLGNIRLEGSSFSRALNGRSRGLAIAIEYAKLARWRPSVSSMVGVHLDIIF